MRKKIFSCWYFIIIAGFLTAVFVFYTVLGENSYFAVHDNLDLFLPQYQMMKRAHTFFRRGADAPFLGGVSRDCLPSEWSLYTMLYMLLPPFSAYVAGYLLKIAIAVGAGYLLARDVIEQDRAARGKTPSEERTNGKALSAAETAVVMLSAFAYGILNLFPNFGIPFASIPLIVWLLRRIYRRSSWKLYAAVFFYPVLSYFSYFGLFLLAYLLLAILLLRIRDKRFSGRLAASLCLLAAGYMVFEYRLFRLMLFGDTVTIRATMKESSLSGGEILREIWNVFSAGMMHADDAHRYLLLPVCLLYLVFLNARYVLRKNFSGLWRDRFNLCMLLLLANSVVYGLYFNETVRNLIETLLPPLKGWQFNRTIFFNPFLWYAAFGIVCLRLVGTGSRKGRAAAYGLLLLSLAVILLQPSRYNDLYQTARNTAYTIRHDGRRPDAMNYREFYAEALFDRIKEDIGYSADDWSVAYMLYPAVLEYNGISTLDGYLGFYPQAYKEAFREVIAPALARMPETAAYYDDWGARCYLYSGTDAAVQMATKSLAGLTDQNLYVNAGALKALGCRYLFSRVRLSNADALGLEMIREYAGEDTGYPVYVYGL